MINVSKVINSRAFSQPITIERTTNGHFVKSQYQADTSLIQLSGVITNPKGSKQISQTDEGSRATGYINVYVDASTPIYTTHDHVNGNDISDKVVMWPGTSHETRYKIFNVQDYRPNGYWQAEAIREGAV